MEQCSNQDLCISDPSVKYHSFICDMFSLIVLCYHSDPSVINQTTIFFFLS
jgi:hypothetical protein